MTRSVVEEEENYEALVVRFIIKNRTRNDATK